MNRLKRSTRFLILALLFFISGPVLAAEPFSFPDLNIDAYGNPIPFSMAPTQQAICNVFRAERCLQMGFVPVGWRSTIPFDMGSNLSGAHLIQLIVRHDPSCATASAILGCRGGPQPGFFWSPHTQHFLTTPHAEYRLAANLIPEWRSYHASHQHLLWLDNLPEDQHLLYSMFGRVSGKEMSCTEKWKGQIEFLVEEKFPSPATPGRRYTKPPGGFLERYGSSGVFASRSLPENPDLPPSRGRVPSSARGACTATRGGPGLPRSSLCASGGDLFMYTLSRECPEIPEFIGRCLTVADSRIGMGLGGTKPSEVVNSVGEWTRPRCPDWVTNSANWLADMRDGCFYLFAVRPYNLLKYGCEVEPDWDGTVRY